jgi:aspartyl-tRNA(Asn)/glutamyl-tRNA(Gln) amidotransferase subunit C
MKITRDDVVRVAQLAYLELSEQELETYRAQIDEILEYIGKLNELDTADVEPMAQVLRTIRRRTRRCGKMWWCRVRWPKRC